MGAAQSSNVAESVAKVSNDVEQSTTTSSNQENLSSNLMVLNDCTFNLRKDFNWDTMNTYQAKASQVTSASQNTDMQNDVSQKMLQEATSTVGSLGVGYADASNTASMYASVSNDVSNNLTTTASQIGINTTEFICNNSTINADNFNVSNTNSTNFLTDQKVSQQQTTKIANTISQSISQKATAKVEGLAGFLLALALVIIAIGWSFAKIGGEMLNNPATRYLIAVAILVVLLAGILCAYAYKAPPFFSDPKYCSGNKRVISVCGGDPCNGGGFNKRTLYLSQAPLRYYYPLIQPLGGNNTVGKTTMIEMAVARACEPDSKSITLPGNKGYNLATRSIFRAKLNNLFANENYQYKLLYKGKTGNDARKQLAIDLNLISQTEADNFTKFVWTTTGDKTEPSKDTFYLFNLNNLHYYLEKDGTTHWPPSGSSIPGIPPFFMADYQFVLSDISTTTATNWGGLTVDNLKTDWVKRIDKATNNWFSAPGLDGVKDKKTQYVNKLKNTFSGSPNQTIVQWKIPSDYASYDKQTKPTDTTTSNCNPGSMESSNLELGIYLGNGLPSSCSQIKTRDPDAKSCFPKITNWPQDNKKAPQEVENVYDVFKSQCITPVIPYAPKNVLFPDLSDAGSIMNAYYGIIKFPDAAANTDKPEDIAAPFNKTNMNNFLKNSKSTLKLSYPYHLSDCHISKYQKEEFYNSKISSSNYRDSDSYVLRNKFIRFVLCFVLDIDTSVSALNDFVTSKADSSGAVYWGLHDDIIKSKDEKDNQIYTVNLGAVYDLENGTQKSGSYEVTGYFAECNNAGYKVQTFMKKAGGYILLVIILALIAYILFKKKGKKKGDK